ncbi:T9SS type A sorting domain-containing protein [Barnesiella sp. ET7]|uniref:T9SS type A sorting domain-containing protein n=1 Tax=Barnesiella sp. ET7 TaxID=2972460 RepID=UPI0021AC7DC9|nr:T9SS type A sorting domain-containing protein [Barnesiella sp. ET7]MCR8910955.1 T9SS type A sorting domain-containing protein [Barnesiella sp. ET7]
MKKIGLLGIFLCLNFMLYSDTLKKVVDVEYKDNTVVSVVLSPDLTMRFADDALVFESEESDNSFALADISGFRYTKRAISGIQEVTAETFVVTAESLQITGLPAGTTVQVYDLNGRLVADEQVDGEFRLAFDRLPGGAYVVRYGQVSRKIIVAPRG